MGPFHHKSSESSYLFAKLWTRWRMSSLYRASHQHLSLSLEVHRHPKLPNGAILPGQLVVNSLLPLPTSAKQLSATWLPSLRLKVFLLRFLGFLVLLSALSSSLLFAIRAIPLQPDLQAQVIRYDLQKVTHVGSILAHLTSS